MAEAVHWSLYAIILIQPLLGWVASSAYRADVPIFGLFNLPITQAHGWNRETFAFALALQNLMWGASQPITGALADKFGAMRIMLIGAHIVKIVRQN